MADGGEKFVACGEDAKHIILSNQDFDATGGIAAFFGIEMGEQRTLCGFVLCVIVQKNGH